MRSSVGILAAGPGTALPVHDGTVAICDSSRTIEISGLVEKVSAYERLDWL